MERRSKLFRSQYNDDVSSTNADHSNCDEEYDPFADEYGYVDELPSWLTPTLPTSFNGSGSKILANSDIDSPTQERTNSEFDEESATSEVFCEKHDEPLITVLTEEGNPTSSVSARPITTAQKV